MKNQLVNGMLEKTILPLNLQFFAEDDGADENKDDQNDNDDGDSDDDSDNNDDDNDNKDKEEKKFTQSELSAVATTEKKQGRKSAFRELGFKNEKEAKAEMAEFKKWKESQLTPEQKAQKDLDDSKEATSEAEKRAQAAEEKLAVVIAGVRKDSIDDVLAIARVKVTEDKSLDDVLNEMKKEERYKSFFGSSEDIANQGTGTNLTHKKGSLTKDNIGARLAKQQHSENKKSSYFN